MMPEPTIDGQLNAVERRLLTEAIIGAAEKPKVLLEVGTWLGGGSTLHILRSLEHNGLGHLWGVEAYQSIYEQMIQNLRAAAPAALGRFTPLFGFSQQVLPKWIVEQGGQVRVDFAFLDGGNRPMEQVDEFRLLEPQIPVGGQLMAHDAKLRKGKWLVPYLSLLDNWRTELHDVSEEGLFHARKLAAQPSPASLRAANARLFRMRCSPAEIAAALLPSAVCGYFLRLLPRRLSRRLSDGRK